MCLEGVCNPQWISCGQDWDAVAVGFTDAERELQAPKVDEIREHRLVSHINFSLSILSLHSSDFWNVPFTGSLFLAKVFCISAPLRYHRELFTQSWRCVCTLFPPLHAALFLHLPALVLPLILLKGLVLVFLLGFSCRLLFPSPDTLSRFLPSHPALRPSPPIMCYCIAWVWKHISLTSHVLICSPSTASQPALLV